MSSEKAGKRESCLPYGTGGEQYVDERYCLHRTSCKQLVRARASATCDEAYILYLLTRFCLSLFAKSAKVRPASLAKEHRAILPSQAENGLHDLAIAPRSAALYVLFKNCLLNTCMHCRVGMHGIEDVRKGQVMLHRQGQLAQQFSRARSHEMRLDKLILLARQY